MTKEKLVSLVRYSDDLTNRLSDPVIPIKHRLREESYKKFLKNELRIVKAQIEAAKLDGVDKK